MIKRKDISPIFAILLLLLFAAVYGIYSAIQFSPFTLHRYKLHDFNEDTTNQIVKMYNIKLPDNVTISKFEKREEMNNCWYTLIIDNADDVDEFLKINPTISNMKVIIDQKPSENQYVGLTPTCFIYSNKIMILVATHCDDDRLVVTDYAKGIENLFNNLWEVKSKKLDVQREKMAAICIFFIALTVIYLLVGFYLNQKAYKILKSAYDNDKISEKTGSIIPFELYSNIRCKLPPLYQENEEYYESAVVSFSICFHVFFRAIISYRLKCEQRYSTSDKVVNDFNKHCKIYFKLENWHWIVTDYYEEP